MGGTGVEGESIDMHSHKHAHTSHVQTMHIHTHMHMLTNTHTQHAQTDRQVVKHFCDSWKQRVEWLADAEKARVERRSRNRKYVNYPFTRSALW